MKRLLLCLGLCLFATGAFAQEKGDIAFVGFNADGDDDFAIVVLNDLPDTTIYFTDDEWNGTSLNGSEGTITWSTGGTVSAGTVVIFTDVDSNGNAGYAVSTGSASNSGSFNLSGSSGDAIWAYTGTSGTPDAFIAAISNDDDEFDGNEGDISGTDLILGVHAIDISNGSGTPDGGEYGGTSSGSVAALQIAIHNSANWITEPSNGEAILPFTLTGLTISSNASVAISGDAGWRMLSLPVTGGTVGDVADDSPVQGVPGGADTSFDPSFYINTASTGTGTSGWTVPTDTSTAWGDGYGFIMYFFDNTSNGSQELPVALDVSGTEPSSVSQTFTNSFMLAGNPYQQNIKLDELDGGDDEAASGVNNGLKSPVWVYSDTAGSYITLNFDKDLSIGRVLSTWQGFFIEQAPSLETIVLSIPSSAKTTEAADSSQFKSSTPRYREISFTLSTDTGYKDLSNKLFYSSKSDAGLDAFDGSKLGSLNGTPLLSFVNDFGDGEKLFTQDAREMNPEGTQFYYMSLNDAGVSGEYTISWPKMFNIPSDWEFTLTDLETRESVSMTEGGNYTFTVQARQKRPNRSVLAQPQVQANPEEFTEPRFEIKLVPGQAVSNEDGPETPAAFALDQNFPNPFNPSTNIRYTIERAGEVRLAVYNMLGQQVAELVNANQASGTYQVSWNAVGNASGVYFYRLESAGQTLTRQMTLIK